MKCWALEYWVKLGHYPLIRDVLLEANGEELGDEFNQNVQHAWTAAINMIIETMSPKKEAINE